LLPAVGTHCPSAFLSIVTPVGGGDGGKCGTQFGSGTGSVVESTSSVGSTLVGEPGAGTTIAAVFGISHDALPMPGGTTSVTWSDTPSPGMIVWMVGKAQVKVEVPRPEHTQGGDALNSPAEKGV
jgi:hypothetical protein